MRVRGVGEVRGKLKKEKEVVEFRDWMFRT